MSAAEPGSRSASESSTDAPIEQSPNKAGPTLPMAEQVAVAAQGDLIGMVIGERYEITERLSAGGMGVVYKARHIVLDSPVAVKVLLKPQDPEAQRRFLQEAKLASLIRHPNTVYISDFGLLPDGRSYLVMEFLQGPTLSRVLSGGRLSVARACQIARQIADGLAAVHHKGIIHRDLKPDNIFLMRDGKKEFVKIVDFGIALAAPEQGLTASLRLLPGGEAGAVPSSVDSALAESTGRQTVPGTILGTPHYISPEQAEGGDVDARTDVYALGCILYEMLTGEVPFDHPTNVLAIMVQHIRNPVIPPRKRCPDARIPESVEAIVLTAMAKRRDERFGSLVELSQALAHELEAFAPDELDSPQELSGSASSMAQRLSTKLVFRPRRWQLWSGLALAVVVTFVSVAVGIRQWKAQESSRRRELSAREIKALRQASLAVLVGHLKPQSGNSPRELRLSALVTAGRTHEIELRSRIEPLLLESDAEVQALAADALGQLGDRESNAALGGLLKPETPAVVRVAVAAALDQLDDERGQRELLQMLDDRDEIIRFRAAYVLTAKGNRKAVAVLSALLERSRAPDDVVLDALTRLAQVGEESARRQLLARLSTSEQSQKRIPIAYRLAQLGEPAGRELLREVAARPGPQQLLAARLYVGPEHPALTEQFREVLRDPEAGIGSQTLATDGMAMGGQLSDIPLLRPRIAPGVEERLRQATSAAILRLSTLDASVLSEQSVRWAESALRDSNWLVRQEGAAVLGDVDTGAASQALAELLKDSDARVRKSATRALARKQSRPALLALREVLYDSDPGVRKEAVKGLLGVARSMLSKGETRVLPDVQAWLQDVLTKGTAVEQALARSGLLRLGDESQRVALQALQKSPDSELRRLFVEQSDPKSSAGSELVALLGDTDSAVRMAAARRLAEQSDKRAIPVLRNALASGGVTAVDAYGLLRRLGEPAEPPRDLDTLLHGVDVNQRMQTVEAIGKLPVELAVPLLFDAARDAERLVRRLVAEVAADLRETPQGPPGLGVLRVLQQDSDAVVRFRAAALLARFGDLSRYRKAGGSVGSVERSGVQQLLRAPVVRQPSTSEPTPVLSTPSTVESGSESSDVSGDRELAAIAEIARGGLAAFASKDYSRALKLLSKAERQCERKKKLAAACATLSFEMTVRVAQIYEKQDQLPEAMAEYEKAMRLVGVSSARPQIKAEADSGQARLRTQLGRVTLPKLVGGRCREVTDWMLPGTNVVTVNGVQTFVKVRPGEIQNLGTCP